MGVNDTVKPTKMELLNLRNKIKLAKKGHKLLKQKQDVLILEFFKILAKAKDLRSELNDEMGGAFKALGRAEAYHGLFEVEALALSVKPVPGLDVKVRNVMGVKIPELERIEVRRKLDDRGYGLLTSSAKVDEAVTSFQGVLDKVIQLAETENAVKRLINEIKKTKRRVNALDLVLIPRMKKQANYIGMRLDEMERENFFTLMKLKGAAE